MTSSSSARSSMALVVFCMGVSLGAALRDVTGDRADSSLEAKAKAKKDDCKVSENDPWDNSPGVFSFFGSTPWCRGYATLVQTLLEDQGKDLKKHTEKIGSNWGDIFTSQEPREFIPHVLALWLLEQTGDIQSQLAYLSAWAGDRTKAGKKLEQKQVGAAVRYLLRNSNEKDFEANSKLLAKAIEDPAEVDPTMLAKWQARGWNKMVGKMYEVVQNKSGCNIKSRLENMVAWVCDGWLMTAAAAKIDLEGPANGRVKVGESVDLLLSENTLLKKNRLTVIQALSKQDG